MIPTRRVGPLLLVIGLLVAVVHVAPAGASLAYGGPYAPEVNRPSAGLATGWVNWKYECPASYCDVYLKLEWAPPYGSWSDLPGSGRWVTGQGGWLSTTGQMKYGTVRYRTVVQEYLRSPSSNQTCGTLQFAPYGVGFSWQTCVQSSGWSYLSRTWTSGRSTGSR